MNMPNPPGRAPDALLPWVALGIALLAPLAIIKLHLVPALLAGLVIHALVRKLAPRLERHFCGRSARLAAVAGLAFLLVAAIGALSLGVTAFLHSDAGSVPALLQKMAEIIESSRSWLPHWALKHLPADKIEIQATAANWLREHAGELRNVGAETLRAVVHALIGMVVGALLSLREIGGAQAAGPLASALAAHANRFSLAFEKVVFAQIQIAAINAVLTGLYLVVALKLFGIHLPLAKTMVVLTFVVGLLPVLGNLISNTVIVVLSLSHSLELGAISLTFLVVLHKLEYFLNAHIVGNRIQARAWELLIAMLVMEALLGIGGLVMAPICYAYLKDELAARRLI